MEISAAEAGARNAALLGYEGEQLREYPRYASPPSLVFPRVRPDAAIAWVSFGMAGIAIALSLAGVEMYPLAMLCTLLPVIVCVPYIAPCTLLYLCDSAGDGQILVFDRLLAAEGPRRGRAGRGTRAEGLPPAPRHPSLKALRRT